MRQTVMKWAALTIAAGLIAFSLLLPNEDSPWETMDRLRRQRMSAEEKVIDGMVGRQAARLRYARTLRQQWQQADAVDRARRATGRELLQFDGVFAETTREMVRENIAGELTELGIEAPVTPVRVIVIPDSSARKYEVRTSDLYTRFTVLPEDPTTEICTVVLRLHDRPLKGGRIDFWDDRRLGTCGFYAKYGMPGAGMRAWLRDLAPSHAALALVPPRYRGLEVEPTANAARVRWAALRREGRGLTDRGKACLAGRPQGCQMMADSPYVSLNRFSNWPRRPNVGRASLNSGTPDGEVPILKTLLARVEARLGRERFLELWRSEAPVPETWQQVLGESPAATVRSEVALSYPTYRANGPIRRAGIGWPLLIAAMGFAAVIRFSRRQIT